MSVKHQDCANVWPQIKQIWLIFTRLKLWIAVARHNIKRGGNLNYLPFQA